MPWLGLSCLVCDCCIFWSYPLVFNLCAEWNFPRLSIGTVHFYFKGCWVLFFIFIQNQNRTFCNLTVETQVRRRALRRLTRVCTTSHKKTLSNTSHKKGVYVPQKRRLRHLKRPLTSHKKEAYVLQKGLIRPTKRRLRPTKTTFTSHKKDVYVPQKGRLRPTKRTLDLYAGVNSLFAL